MTADLTTYPTAEQTFEPDVEADTFLDRAGALVRSWSARSGSPTMADVLTEWRLSERDLEATTPGSEAWNEASQRFLRARTEYGRLFQVAAMNADSLRHLW